TVDDVAAVSFAQLADALPERQINSALAGLCELFTDRQQMSEPPAYIELLQPSGFFRQTQPVVRSPGQRHAVNAADADHHVFEVPLEDAHHHDPTGRDFHRS